MQASVAILAQSSERRVPSVRSTAAVPDGRENLAAAAQLHLETGLAGVYL